MKDEFGWEITVDPQPVAPDLAELKMIWKKRLEVTQMNCPRCGTAMRFMPFCMGKAKLGFAGRFDCRNCGKHVFITNEEWYEQFGKLVL